MQNDTITKTVFFDAPNETVWDFLTKREKLALWFHAPVADFEDGKAFEMLAENEDGSTNKLCWGTVLKMDAPNCLVYSFTIKPLNLEMTTVTCTLGELAGGTRLVLKHEGIAAAVGDKSPIGLLMDLDKGWDRHFASFREQV